MSRKRLTTEEFIRRAKKIHGVKYIYEKVNYQGYDEKVVIICPIHGNFLQSPDGHLHKNGCPNCAPNKKLSQKDFIQRATKIHNNKYDYSKSCYREIMAKLTITCPIHGDFQQSANGHLSGHGCSKCGGTGKSNKEEFVRKANEVHKNKFDYSKAVYINDSAKITITCPTHDDFQQSANSHLQGHDCGKCAGLTRATTEEFVKKARKYPWR